jgi:ATP-dependent DNA helicase PIF1
LGQKGLQVYEYELEVTVAPKNQKEKLKKACPAPEIVRLCVGSQVMLLYNMDIALGFVNGSRGVVTRFDEDSMPFVRFTNGMEMLVQYHEWITREQDEIVFSVSQIPLRLAYAVSIHKSQGCSLDCAIIDLSKIFEYGQGYVALSRVRNLEGLSIKSLDPSLLQAHPKAIEFYSSL